MTALGEPRLAPRGLVERLREAEAMFESGDVDAARAALEALDADPATPVATRGEVLSDLAVIAAAQGQATRARELAGRALALLPGHAPAQEVLAFCAAARERDSDAHSLGLQAARIAEFARLSTCARVHGTPLLRQPLLTLGRGEIAFGDAVEFGWRQSPGFHDRSAYVEAAHDQTRIEIGARTFFNNGATLRAEGPGISVGADCLFGWEVQLLDSDFHDLHPARRRTGRPVTQHVRIGDNVFVGASTIVMKGVEIGDDTVVGAGSVVLRSLPAGVIAAGNPARVIRELTPGEPRPGTRPMG